MRKVKIYKLEKKDSLLDEFVIDVYMEDGLKSHRYYFLSLSSFGSSIKYIKSIDLILDYLDRSNLILNELEPQIYEKLITLVQKLIKSNLIDNNDLNYSLKEQNNDTYFNELIDYDKLVLNELSANDSSKEKHYLEKGI